MEIPMAFTALQARYVHHFPAIVRLAAPVGGRPGERYSLSMLP
jgi:hypothetical protein